MAPPQAPAEAPYPARMPSRPPKYEIEKDGQTSTIRIDDWTITATKRPILNGKEIDAAEKRLNLPLPEMTFGNNSLTLRYRPGPPPQHAQVAGQSSVVAQEQPSETSSVTLAWNALDALAEVAVGEGWEERVGGGVQVAMAEKWSKGRSSPSSLLSDTPLPTTPVKPHDWTYSTTFAGSVAGPSTFEPSSSHHLPLALLSRQDPVLDQILFYEDVPLFEDELHDNGESLYNVRIRVMPHSFFILTRLFLRVDSVLFRICDVRVYHAFGSGEIIREVRGMEASYDEVKERLKRQSDLSPLTDPNFVYQAMMAINAPLQSPDGSGGSGDQQRPELDHRPRSRVRGKPWPGLGTRVEVMQLPTEEQAVQEGMRTLAL